MPTASAPTAGRRLAFLLFVGLVPWVAVVSSGPDASVTFVTSFGLVAPDPFHLTPLPTYLFVLTRGLPASLLAWPVASLLWGLTLAGAAAGRLAGREDRRLTGGLLVLAGASLVSASLAVGRPAGVTALPVGTMACWLAAWWGYRPALAAIVAAGGSGGR